MCVRGLNSCDHLLSHECSQCSKCHLKNDLALLLQKLVQLVEVYSWGMIGSTSATKNVSQVTEMILIRSKSWAYQFVGLVLLYDVINDAVPVRSGIVVL